jgi:hypothetical protein
METRPRRKLLLVAIMLTTLLDGPSAFGAQPEHDPALLHPFNPPGLWQGEGIAFVGGRLLDNSLDVFNLKSGLGAGGSVGNYKSYYGGVRYGLFDRIELFADAERAQANVSQSLGSLYVTAVNGGGRVVFRDQQHGLVGSLEVGYRAHLGQQFTADRFTVNIDGGSVTITAPAGRHLIDGNSTDGDLYTRVVLGKIIIEDKLKLYSLLGFHFVMDRSAFDFSLLAPFLNASDSTLFTRVQQNLGRTEQQYEVGTGFHFRPIERIALNVGWRYTWITRQWPAGGFANQLNTNQTVEANLDLRLLKQLHLLFEATYFQHLLLTQYPGLYNERTAPKFDNPYGYLGVSLRLFFLTGL